MCKVISSVYWLGTWTIKWTVIFSCIHVCSLKHCASMQHHATPKNVPFRKNFHDIFIEFSKDRSTKPHEDSVTLLGIKLEMRCKDSMEKDRHFTLLVCGKIFCVVSTIVIIFTTCTILISFFVLRLLALLLFMASGLVFFTFRGCVFSWPFSGGISFLYFLPVKKRRPVATSSFRPRPKDERLFIRRIELCELR